MDPTDSGEGQEKASKECLFLTPTSKGRQRKKNPKYLDYETEDTVINEDVKQKSPIKSLGKDGSVAQKSQAEGRKPTPAVKQTADDAKESAVKASPDPVGETVPVTPKKRGRPKKTQSAATPKVTVTADGDLPAGEAAISIADNSVQQENGTPKAKRKYVRKQDVQVNGTPKAKRKYVRKKDVQVNGTPKAKRKYVRKQDVQVNGTPKAKRKYVRKKDVQVIEDPPGERAPEEPPDEPEEKTESGGRRRRGAAKTALKYLQILAKEVFSHSGDDPGSEPSSNNEDNVSEKKRLKQRKGRKRKHRNSEAAEDEDFVPDIGEDEAGVMEDESEEEEVEEEESDADLEIVASKKRLSVLSKRHHTTSGGKPVNGVEFNIIRTVWDSAKVTKTFREEHYSSWVFPQWVPSIKDWDPVEESHLEEFLPQELQSADFKVTREDLSKEETPRLRLSRFESVPAHSERWDMLLFAGGPVWSSEWCPTPDGASATQYLALACHRGMDDLHHVNQTYTGPGLVQLWDCGKLEYDIRPDTQPVLVYGLAQDKGFIWQLKWCPAGGWEPPSCGRKTPFMPRLGLLAVATSSSVVTVYSLPHPDALLSNKKLSDSDKDSEKLPVYKARGVITLKLGSIKAPREEKSGQVLSMDWLPQKPHNIIAIGFYDGVVGLWDLSTKSALLRVRESDRSLSLLPYQCLPAHDNAVRALAFCPASRYLLATAGDDRCVKMWDLRRLYDPIKVQKRYLNNEICWPLDAPGVLKAKESAFVPRGSMGIHYFDHNLNSYFAVPRSSSVWSMSYSEWLHSVSSADDLGEVALSMLPPLNRSVPNIKRSVLRRFPAYFTSKVACDAAEDEREEEGVNKQEGREAEKTEGGSEGGNEKDNEGGEARRDTSPHLQFPSYKEAVEKYYLHYSDFNMENLKRMEKRALWKKLQSTESTANVDSDEMPLTALHKVRFNPNMSSHVWLASGGQTGLVRLHCVRTLITPHLQKMIADTQAQFSTLYSPQGQQEAVQKAAEPL